MLEYLVTITERVSVIFEDVTAAGDDVTKLVLRIDSYELFSLVILQCCYCDCITWQISSGVYTWQSVNVQGFVLTIHHFCLVDYK
jgi:hypothetical protein